MLDSAWLMLAICYRQTRSLSIVGEYLQFLASNLVVLAGYSNLAVCALDHRAHLTEYAPRSWLESSLGYGSWGFLGQSLGCVYATPIHPGVCFAIALTSIQYCLHFVVGLTQTTWLTNAFLLPHSCIRLA